MPNPKKILITLNNTDVSGIENFALTLIQNLSKNNYKFVVAVPDNGNIIDDFMKIGVEYFVFNSIRRKAYNLKRNFQSICFPDKEQI